MTISIFRWTDGPYLAFTDPNERRYILEGERAILLLDRVRAHIAPAPDRSLIVDQRFVRNPVRDLNVIEIYLQDCDNLFEVLTPTGPILQATAIEVGTMLWLAVEPVSHVETRLPRSFPAPDIDPAIIAAMGAGGTAGISYN
ncbi:MAG: hypothetical protein KC438_00680 [Thermomicrobiales bacterium]|nr:hypothetical protein [Thermomicrobiales bacterium]MCO5221726.1 hypothetical protein [Thermomicrobiales bacterium]